MAVTVVARPPQLPTTARVKEIRLNFGTTDSSGGYLKRPSVTIVASLATPMYGKVSTEADNYTPFPPIPAVPEPPVTPPEPAMTPPDGVPLPFDVTSAYQYSEWWPGADDCTLEILSPASGERVTSGIAPGSAMMVCGIASNFVHVSSASGVWYPIVVVNIYGESVTATINPTAAGTTRDGTWVAYISIPEGGWNDSSATIYARAFQRFWTDSSANSYTLADASANSKFIIDMTPPSIYFYYPINGATLYTTPAAFSGTCTEPWDIASGIVELTLDGTTVTAAIDASGRWGVSWPSANELPPKSYTATAQVTDAGDVTPSSYTTLTFTIRQDVPRVTIDAPVEGSTVNNPFPVIRGTSCNKNSTLSASIDESYLVTASVDEYGDYSFIWPILVVDGVHSVTVSSSGTGGLHIMASNFTVDAIDPDPTLSQNIAIKDIMGFQAHKDAGYNTTISITDIPEIMGSFLDLMRDANYYAEAYISDAAFRTALNWNIGE